MQREKSPCFVLHPAQLPLAAGALVAQQPCSSSLVFSINRTQPAFAWLGSGRLHGPRLPFAKVGIWDPPASTDSLMKQLLSEEPDEPQGPRRGHTDEWYQQRCIFCADCKSTINSHYQKRGSRCQGCRRWFHASCIPATAPRAPGPEEAGEQQDTGAADADNTNGSGSSRRSKRRNLFFHDDDCQEATSCMCAPGNNVEPRPDRDRQQSRQAPHNSRERSRERHMDNERNRQRGKEGGREQEQQRDRDRGEHPASRDEGRRQDWGSSRGGREERHLADEGGGRDGRHQQHHQRGDVPAQQQREDRGGGRGPGGAGRQQQQQRRGGGDSPQGKPKWGKPEEWAADEPPPPGPPKQEPNMGLSGKLAAETNKTADGSAELKFQAPAEARVCKKPVWKLFVYKGADTTGEPINLTQMPFYLFGKDRKVADIPTDHPSCSRQHAVIVFREVQIDAPDGLGYQRVVKPYLLDLETTNGTTINNERLEGARYYEVLSGDVIRFGFSSRDYVIMNESVV